MEEQFYLRWPVSLLLIGRQRAVIAAVALMIIVPPLRFAWMMGLEPLAGVDVPVPVPGGLACRQRAVGTCRVETRALGALSSAGRATERCARVACGRSS